MNRKMCWAVLMMVAAAAPLSAGSKKKNQSERGMLEKMEAVPCGAKERGVNGLGTVWASVGVTRVNSDEKLCPEYLLRTDEMEYHIRPMDTKHPTVLPIGHEGEFTIKNDRMFLKVDEGDRKMRSFRVVSENPTADSSGTPGQDVKNQPEKP